VGHAWVLFDRTVGERGVVARGPRRGLVDAGWGAMDGVL